MKHIVLTGGGTAGHVTPNIALVPVLREAGYQISYIGPTKVLSANSLKNWIFPTMVYRLVN